MKGTPDKFKHFHLKDVDTDFDNPMHITTRLYADVVDMTNNTIVDACVKAARQAGINDVYLLDKQFVLDAIREKIEEKSSLWISVEERLPELGEVLVCTHGNWIGVVWHHGKGKFETGGGMLLGECDIAHWMPLPEPPKEE